MFYDSFSGNRENLAEHYPHGNAVEFKNLPMSGRRGKERTAMVGARAPQWEESRAFLSYLARCPLGAGRGNFLKRGAGRLEKLHKSIMTTTAIQNNGEQDSTPVRGESQLSEQIKHWKEKTRLKKTHTMKKEKDKPELQSTLQNVMHLVKSRTTDIKGSPSSGLDHEGSPSSGLNHSEQKNPRNLQKRAENMEIPQIPSYIVGGLLPGGPQ